MPSKSETEGSEFWISEEFERFRDPNNVVCVTKATVHGTIGTRPWLSSGYVVLNKMYTIETDHFSMLFMLDVTQDT